MCSACAGHVPVSGGPNSTANKRQSASGSNTLEVTVVFRVPTDPNNPTYDSTYKVSFWEWLTSTKRERQLWRIRRDAAARLAARNQQRRWNDRLDPGRHREPDDEQDGDRTVGKSW